MEDVVWVHGAAVWGGEDIFIFLLHTLEYKSYEELPLMLTAPEVAAVLDVSRAGAYELAHSEGFPVLKAGKWIVIPKDKFLLWAENGTAGDDAVTFESLSSSALTERSSKRNTQVTTKAGGRKRYSRLRICQV